MILTDRVLTVIWITVGGLLAWDVTWLQSLLKWSIPGCSSPGPLSRGTARSRSSSSSFH